MHFSQILNSGERQKIYHKNADDGAHQINHPVRKLLHLFRPQSSVDPPVRRDKKVDGQVMGKRQTTRKLGMVWNDSE